MITYLEQLTLEEQQQLKELVQLLFRQTFVLERKYDKRTERFTVTKEYRFMEQHLAFLKAYFAVAGITVHENSQLGLFYLQGETVLGEKLPKTATIYLLVLKLIYEEQMEQASTSMQIYTSLGEINKKAAEFHMLKATPSQTDMRRALVLLKKYQLIEPLGLLDDLSGASKMIIYPSVQAVLLSEDMRELIMSFKEEEEGYHGE